MDGFTFFRSYYESAQHLNDDDQAVFYKLIMDYMFTGLEPKLDGHLMGFWLLVKPNLDTSKSRAKAGQTKSKPNQKRNKPKSKPKPSPLEDKDKDKDIGVISKDINRKAFELWCDHKGKRYSKRAKTLTCNLLAKYDHPTQLKMVETSIMNSWSGLFEPKDNKTVNSKSSTMELVDSYFQNKKEVIDAELS